MGGRVVLHSDLNNCYASIECMLHPELRGSSLRFAAARRIVMELFLQRISWQSSVG